MKFDVDNHTNNVQQITTLPTGNDLNDYQLARDRKIRQIVRLTRF